ncbi:hypothetical protein CEXT_513331 [Caerostris extrusa]|uniref:Uncharacterized protein n=1 Tax=Caerostris extrusa TaxID=172846 RepID=A0AAV4VAL4_CAEEX|nr:hypothetical protein CEXT_513331 [Caerostris extrusa]
MGCLGMVSNPSDAIERHSRWRVLLMPKIVFQWFRCLSCFSWYFSCPWARKLTEVACKGVFATFQIELLSMLRATLSVILRVITFELYSGRNRVTSLQLSDKTWISIAIHNDGIFFLRELKLIGLCCTSMLLLSVDLQTIELAMLPLLPLTPSNCPDKRGDLEIIVNRDLVA